MTDVHLEALAIPLVIGDESGGNTTTFATDGSVTHQGDAAVWDDYVTPLGPNNWNGASNNPTLTKLFDDAAGTSQGVYSYVFSDGDEALITVQMPHRWKEGSTIQPHIHFMCTSDVDPADNFGIEFEYIWADSNEDFPAFAKMYWRVSNKEKSKYEET